MHVRSAIPQSARNAEKYHIRNMVHGDPIQLLYHFWIFGDMLRGDTPWFHNLYEFNTGDDSTRKEVNAYYAPFSLIYALFEPRAGRALAWNLTGFLTLWGTCLLSFALARRLMPGGTAVQALAAGLLTLAAPFQWTSLLGGSPMGYALLWAPALALGTDLAVRDGARRGGVIAGAAVLFSCWADSHLFFFGVLSIPLWALFAVIRAPGCDLRDPVLWKRRLAAGVLFALFVVIAFRTNGAVKPVGGQDDVMSGARSWNEVMLCSPDWTGLFDSKLLGTTSSHVFLGYTVPVLLLLAWLAVWLGVVFPAQPGGRATRVRCLLLLALLTVALGAIIVLALGGRGPFEGLGLQFARKILPPYGMIRQPAKIFCLLPVLLLYLAVFARAAVDTVRAGRRFRPAVFWWLAVAVVLAEFALRCDASLVRLDPSQGAYRAVAEHAAAQAQQPRALVVPLWPGDSAYASTYQYYASLYRLRILNGYSPRIHRDYVENIFRRFESINQGCADDAQLDDLLARGIRYILVHENMFPEQVSPFPIGRTLESLMNHSRIELLARAETVWAFRILAAPESGHGTNRFMTLYAPAKRWEAERMESTNVTASLDLASASEGTAINLLDSRSVIRTRLSRLFLDKPAAWRVRARGNGTLVPELIRDGTTNRLPGMVVVSSRWQWLDIPVAPRGFEELALQLTCADSPSGTVQVDYVYLAMGDWAPPGPGETLILPARTFFHAGYLDDTLASVVFRKDYDPVSIVFYGPMLPLPAGRYRIEMSFAAEAPVGTALGMFNVRREMREPLVWTPVTQGEPAVRYFEQEHDLRFYLEFAFTRNADVRIGDVRLSRVE